MAIGPNLQAEIDRIEDPARRALVQEHFERELSDSLQDRLTAAHAADLFPKQTPWKRATRWLREAGELLGIAAICLAAVAAVAGLFGVGVGVFLGAVRMLWRLAAI